MFLHSKKKIFHFVQSVCERVNIIMSSAQTTSSSSSKDTNDKSKGSYDPVQGNKKARSWIKEECCFVSLEN